MTAGDRFKTWIDATAVGWADRMATWGMGMLARGATKTLEDMEPAIINQTRETIQSVIDNPKTPPETKRLLEVTIKEGNIFHVVMGWALSIIGLIPALFGLGQPVGNIFNQMQELALRSQILDPETALRVWRRDPEKFPDALEELKYGGWSDIRIEALKLATLIWPSRQDLIRYVAKEALEPEAISKYGLLAEFDRLDLTLFDQIGVSRETARLDWIAHWEHASWMQIVEMLHRGIITEQDVWDWFRLVEIPPFWRQHLIDTSYTWPTRVDVRRWWDMRTIDETELRRLYSGMGYRGVNLDNYILWTKVYVAFPDLMARWSKGWITLDNVRSELTGMGMPAERLEEFIQMKVKAEQPERTAKERDITKTDIVKGVRQGVITRGEGVELLVDMGYDEDEAVYILEINIPPDDEEVVVRQRELTKADILKGLKTEVITRAAAKTELLDLRYSPTDAEFLLKIFDAQVEPPVEPRAREASKADIIAAVKKGLITPEDAYLMLQDIGFTPEASQFILEVRAEMSPFSPVSFSEFKDRSHKYRKAAGMEAKEMPEEIRSAAAEVVRLTGEVEALTRSIEEEKQGLIEKEVLPAETTERLTELQVTRNRAAAELSRVQSEYDRLLAEWKHKAE